MYGYTFRFETPILPLDRKRFLSAISPIPLTEIVSLTTLRLLRHGIVLLRNEPSCLKIQLTAKATISMFFNRYLNPECVGSLGGATPLPPPVTTLTTSGGSPYKHSPRRVAPRPYLTPRMTSTCREGRLHVAVISPHNLSLDT